MLHLYGINSCDSCRKARQWLEDQDLDYEYHDIRIDGLEKERLRDWQARVGWEELLNRRSLTWRKIPSFDRDNLDANAAMALIEAYPTVMKRPVLDGAGDETLLVGFDADRYEEILADH